MTVEQQIADMQQASVEQTQASQALADEVAGKMGEIDKKLISAEQEFNDFISGARKEYSRFTHYIALPEKLVIDSLGLTDEQAESYSYSEVGDYSPAREDGALCFADIIEFANGFSQLSIPTGMSVYLTLLVNVSGSSNATQYSKIHLLVERKGTSGFYQHEVPSAPYIYKNDDSIVYELSGRNWGDSYNDKNELKISNYGISNDYRQGALRIVNLGASAIEVFGIGIEVRV